MDYPKGLRISDLGSSAREIHDLTHGLRGIRNTAERVGDERLTAEATRWIAAAEELREEIHMSLERERGVGA